MSFGKFVTIAKRLLFRIYNSFNGSILTVSIVVGVSRQVSFRIVCPMLKRLEDVVLEKNCCLKSSLLNVFYASHTGRAGSR